MCPEWDIAGVDEGFKFLLWCCLRRWRALAHDLDTALAMTGSLSFFLERHAQVFTDCVLPHLHLLALRSAACSCKALHHAISQTGASTWEQVRHNTWLLARSNLGRSETIPAITSSYPWSPYVALDGKLAAIHCDTQLFIVRWQIPGDVVARVRLPYFSKVCTERVVQPVSLASVWRIRRLSVCVQVSSCCPLRWDSASQCVAGILDILSIRGVPAVPKWDVQEHAAAIVQSSSSPAVANPSPPRDRALPDACAGVSADSSTQPHAAAAAAANCRGSCTASTDSSSIPDLDMVLPYSSSDEYGDSSDDAQSLNLGQVLVVWSMQHSRLVEVDLGARPEEAVWFSYAGRPWAPSKPILAVLTLEAGDDVLGSDACTSVRVLDIFGVQQASANIPGVWVLRWAPDSCRLAAGTKDAIHVLDIMSGACQSIALPGYGVAWSSDSRHLVCCGASGFKHFVSSQAEQLQEVASSPAQFGTVTHMAWHGALLVVFTEEQTTCFVVDDEFQLTVGQTFPPHVGCPAISYVGNCLSIAGTVEVNDGDQLWAHVILLPDHTTSRKLSIIPVREADQPALDFEYDWSHDRYSLIMSSREYGRGYMHHEYFFLQQPDLADIHSRCTAWNDFYAEVLLPQA